MTHKHILFATHLDTERDAFRFAFAQAYPGIQFSAVSSAAELIVRLQTQSVHEISFVLVDLDLPGLRETEVLRRLSENVQYRSLPVVVMSDTDVAQDVVETYQLGASAFVGRPHNELSRMRTVKAMGDFWLDINVTPKPEVSMF